jgi:hypothetical protein
VLEKLPLLVLVGVFCAVTLWAQGPAMSALAGVSLPQRLGNAVVSYAAYLWQAVLPLGLAVHYPHPGASLSGAAVAEAGVVLTAVTALVVVGRRRGYLPVGWFWYLGMLVPVIGLVQVGAQARADRFTYLPLVGVFVMVVWGLADLARHWQCQKPAAFLAGAALAALMAAAWVQVGYWQSSVSLWQHSLEVTGSHALAHSQLASALLSRRPPDYWQAREHFGKAAELEPEDPAHQFNLGGTCLRTGDLELAVAHLQRAVDLGENTEKKPPARVYALLAEALIKLGLKEEAMASSAQAAGRVQEAAALSTKAAEHYQQALARSRDALRLKPGMTAAQGMIDFLSEKKGRRERGSRP